MPSLTTWHDRAALADETVRSTSPSPTPMRTGAPQQLESRRRFLVLDAVLLALFLGSLDQTVVGTALPRTVTDLGGNEFYTWVVTAYLLSSTITVPIYGKLYPDPLPGLNLEFSCRNATG